MRRKKKLIICRCEEITEEEICDSIKRGAKTVTETKKMTRAGMGLCQGRICGRLVVRILSEMTAKKPEEIALDTARVPVKPIKLSILAGGKSKDEG